MSEAKQRGAMRRTQEDFSLGSCNNTVVFYARTITKDPRFGEDIETFDPIGTAHPAQVMAYNQKDKVIDDFDTNEVKLRVRCYIDAATVGWLQTGKFRAAIAFVAYEIAELKQSHDQQFVDFIAFINLNDI